jgi:hypothetical protein
VFLNNEFICTGAELNFRQEDSLFFLTFGGGTSSLPMVIDCVLHVFYLFSALDLIFIM